MPPGLSYTSGLQPGTTTVGLRVDVEVHISHWSAIVISLPLWDHEFRARAPLWHSVTLWKVQAETQSTFKEAHPVSMSLAHFSNILRKLLCGFTQATRSAQTNTDAQNTSNTFLLTHTHRTAIKTGIHLSVCTC